LMDASHSDVNTAYAAVNRIRCDDMRPHIYKTNDGGKTWKEIVNGLPEDPINVVREDPKRKGLLFAGSERSVYVSFDEGEHWQSLRLNMPATSIRDLVIKDDDIVIGTHGRSFWILDDITPLRQLLALDANQPVILYTPQTTYRVRWDMYTDTPLPQEEPAGQNPPDGAIINYYLKEKVTGEMSLEIFDTKGKSIRKYSSQDKPYEIPAVNIPRYWIRPQQVLSTEAGSHRFTWDLKYAPLDVPASYPIGATYMNTEPNQTSPWVMPGTYTIKLTADGKIYTQSLTVKMDPRVKTAVADLQKQHDLSLQCYESRKQCAEILKEIQRFRVMLQSQLTSAMIKVAEKLGPLERKAGQLENTPQGSQEPSFGRINNSFASIFNILQNSDRPPTSQAISALAETQNQKQQLMIKWKEIKSKQ